MYKMGLYYQLFMRRLKNINYKDTIKGPYTNLLNGFAWGGNTPIYRCPHVPPLKTLGFLRAVFLIR